jgi:hypothetical protein
MEAVAMFIMLTLFVLMGEFALKQFRQNKELSTTNERLVKELKECSVEVDTAGYIRMFEAQEQRARGCATAIHDLCKSYKDPSKCFKMMQYVCEM